MKVLVIEDDELIRDILVKVLEKNGFTQNAVGTGEEGLSLAQANSYDAIVLDINLPTIDGYEVLKQIRARGGHTPVLLLTSRRNIGDRVRGLDLGADDYLSKPFEYEELIERLRAIMRRGKLPLR
ncbi:MAG: response regulator [Nitrospirota bacterium]|nr:response regulator [Nitrospirota bacterium]